MIRRSVKSAERTLALFEMFSDHQRPMTVGEIARAMDIPQPSASMLLRNLTALGYLEHDRHTRTFIPSIRIVLLGSWIHRRLSQERNLEWRLEQLHSRTGETTFLGIQNEISVQYILGVGVLNPLEGDHEQNFEVPSGLMRPMAPSAAGRILLSLKPDDDIRAIVRRANAEAKEERFRVNLAEFMTLIARVREQGYAETGGEVTPGMGAIAMAVSGIVGDSPVAVAVGAPLVRLRQKKALILRELAEFVAPFNSPAPTPPEVS